MSDVAAGTDDGRLIHARGAATGHVTTRENVVGCRISDETRRWR